MTLAEFPILEHLNATQIENLRAVCEERTLDAGTTLIRHGESGGKLYLVLEGTLQVYMPGNGRDIDLAEIHAPAVVGELELFTGHPRTASVRATTKVHLMAVSHERVLARVADGDPAILKVMFAIAKTVACRLVSATEKFVEIERTAPAPHADELRAFRTKLFSEWS